MRILILQDDFPPSHKGGAGVIARNLALGYKKKGNEVLVITTQQEKEGISRERENDVEIVRIFSSYNERWRSYLSVYNPQTIGEIKKIIQEWKPDIVHVHNIHNYISYHSIKLAFTSGARIFLTAHDAMLFHYGKTKDTKRVNEFELMMQYKLRYNPFRNYLIRRYLKYVEKIIAVSHALQDALLNNSIDCKYVIHNGIDVTNWYESPAHTLNFKSRYELNGNVILFGGRLSYAKGGKEIIKIVSEVAKTIPDVQLLVIGEKDTYGRQMIEYARFLGVSSSLIFAGWLRDQDLKAAYYSSGLVIVPSLYLDPFPTINLEAMAATKPVIATCFGGSSEAVLEGMTGYIINPYDTEKMSLGAVKFLQDEKLNIQYGKAGLQRVKEKFSLDTQIQAYIYLFEN